MSFPIYADLCELLMTRAKPNDSMRPKDWDSEYTVGNTTLIALLMLNACKTKVIEEEFHAALRNHQMVSPHCTPECAETKLLEWADNAQRVSGQVMRAEVKAAVTQRVFNKPVGSVETAKKIVAVSADLKGRVDKSHKGRAFLRILQEIRALGS